MKSSQFLEEGFVEDAHDVHLDHEVQMARADCFHVAEDALALHKLLRSIDEQQGLEGWVSAKITLAADYLKTVREYLEYELMTGSSGDVEGDEVSMTMPETLATPIETASALISPALPVAEGEVTKTTTGLKHKAKDKYGAGEEPNHMGGHRGGFPNPGKYARDLDSVNKDLVKNLDASMGITWKNQGTKGVKVDETSAGSVATVVNPTPKNKAKVGSLFGGTYKQSKAK